jgi:hypothetical protein
MLPQQRHSTTKEQEQANRNTINTTNDSVKQQKAEEAQIQG